MSISQVKSISKSGEVRLRAEPPLARVTQLDGIRGLGFIGVFLTHLRLPHGFPAAHPWLAQGREVGWIGVPVFFALSGYIITELALRDGPHFSLPRFYARRALRLWPLFFTAVLVALAAWHWPQLRELRLATSPGWALPLCTFTMNFPLGRNPAAIASIGALSPLWTLCVEMQFYFVWALVLRYTSRRVALGVCVAIFLASVAARFFIPLETTFLFYRMNTILNCPTLMLGGALALIKVQRCQMSAIASNALLALLLVAGVIVGYLQWPFPTKTWAGALLLCAADLIALISLLLLLCGRNALRTICEWRPMRRLGELSYAAYVMHLAILWSYYPIKQRLLGMSSSHLVGTPSLLLDIVTGLSATILCASLWHRLERPLQQARSRLQNPGVAELEVATLP